MATTLLYLLHIDPPFARVAHYLGKTQPGRLTTRLNEHRTGQGAKLLKAVAAKNHSVRLAAVIETSDPGAEQAYKKTGRLKKFCDICAGRRHAFECVEVWQGPVVINESQWTPFTFGSDIERAD